MTTDDAERTLLVERILAEQEERRRLAELLHDGPVQHLSAITQLVDAALASLRDEEVEHADELLTRGLELARDASRDLRGLCDDLEPTTLRKVGFVAAVGALARRMAEWHEVAIELDVEHGAELGEHAQTALYQIIRETVDQAVRRGAPSHIEISLRSKSRGGATLVIADDGPPERRSAVLELLAERAATLNARFTSEVRYPRGSTIRIEIPPSAARR